MKRIVLTALITVLVCALTIAMIAASGLIQITVDPSIKILVSGEEFKPKDANGKDVMTFVYNGTTYAPVRALAEAYGLEVGYDSTLNMATVDRPGENVEQPTDVTETALAGGKIDGNVYTNESIGIGLKLPESWAFADEEQLTQIFGAVTDTLGTSSAELSALLEESASLVNTIAFDSIGNNISIAFENIGVSLTAEQYFSLAKENMRATLEGAGFSNLVMEDITVELAGKELQAMKISSTMLGYDTNQLSIAIPSGNCMVLITITTMSDMAPESILQYFFAVE